MDGYGVFSEWVAVLFGRLGIFEQVGGQVGGRVGEMVG